MVGRWPHLRGEDSPQLPPPLVPSPPNPPTALRTTSVSSWSSTTAHRPLAHGDLTRCAATDRIRRIEPMCQQQDSSCACAFHVWVPYRQAPLVPACAWSPRPKTSKAQRESQRERSLVWHTGALFRGHGAALQVRHALLQGREKDVVIVSTVRSGPGGLGFVADLRRMNVAITRAKHGLYILGDSNTLSQSSDWDALIRDARERSCFRSVASKADMWQDSGKNSAPMAQPPSDFDRMIQRDKRKKARQQMDPCNAAGEKPRDSASKKDPKSVVTKAVSQKPAASKASHGTERKREVTSLGSEPKRRVVQAMGASATGVQGGPKSKVSNVRTHGALSASRPQVSKHGGMTQAVAGNPQPPQQSRPQQSAVQRVAPKSSVRTSALSSGFLERPAQSNNRAESAASSGTKRTRDFDSFEDDLGKKRRSVQMVDGAPSFGKKGRMGRFK